MSLSVWNLTVPKLNQACFSSHTISKSLAKTLQGVFTEEVPEPETIIEVWFCPHPQSVPSAFKAKAGFKVGFASIDKRLNHFMIDTNAENYIVFMSELFKYLKILNKI